MPRVATIENPSRVKRSATSATAGLSSSRTLTKTVPFAGSLKPLASIALPNASAKLSPIPMTSPVERISGPSTMSTSGKRLNGSTASLTAT